MLAEGRGLALVRGGRLLFEDLDFAVSSGGALLLTGPNGAGKSSLLRLIAGLLNPDAGRIDRADAALADEGLALDRELPLASALAFWGGPRLHEAMRDFGLRDLADVPVRLLSTGQARRARLARVAATDAPLWLLDEPLNGLDRDGIAALDAAIARHRKNGGAVIAASHVAPSGQWERLEIGA